MHTFLVLRKDIIRPNQQISSSCFPIEVILTNEEVSEWSSSEEYAEFIVRKALDTFRHGYVGMYEYVVVSLFDAKIVSFKPKKSYNVEVRSY